MLNLIFDALMLAMPVTLIVIGVTVLQTKERYADAPGGRPISALASSIQPLKTRDRRPIQH